MAKLKLNWILGCVSFINLKSVLIFFQNALLLLPYGFVWKYACIHLKLCKKQTNAIKIKQQQQQQQQQRKKLQKTKTNKQTKTTQTDIFCLHCKYVVNNAILINGKSKCIEMFSNCSFFYLFFNYHMH